MIKNSNKVTSITTTLNEEEHIGDCLESISWCEEHIVIDEYSNDKTVEIAESHGAEVYQMKTPDNANTYEILREEAIKKATNDWILRIDADERSHKKLNSKLKKFVGSSSIDIVQVPRMTHLDDEWIQFGRGWWPDRSPILFQKDCMEIEDRIHRSMTPTDDAEIILLPAERESALYHYSYSSVPDLVKRYWRWSKTEAEVYDLPFYGLLYLAFSDFIQGAIVDRGIFEGYDGVLIPAINSLYFIFIIYHRILNRI